MARAGRSEPQNAEQGMSNVQVENGHSTFAFQLGPAPLDVESAHGLSKGEELAALMSFLRYSALKIGGNEPEA
jgi:hypothetical protein